MECYTDFMRNFRDAFLDDVGTSITEIVIGSGPCGELRYPAYVEANGWRFPGVRMCLLHADRHQGPEGNMGRHTCRLHALCNQSISSRWATATQLQPD